MAAFHHQRTFAPPFGGSLNERPITASAARKRPFRYPPNPDIQGRHASDFCIKRSYDFRGSEPDADLVNLHHVGFTTRF